MSPIDTAIEPRRAARTASVQTLEVPKVGRAEGWKMLADDAPVALLPAPRTAALAPRSSTTSPVTTGPSTAEQVLAQQKAHFVAETFALAKREKIALKHACSLVAARAQDDFPELLTAGKGGGSAVAQTNAWPNYRAWARALGTADGSKAPDAGNWTALCARYCGSRDYVKPGAERFWSILANLFEHPNKLALRYAYQLATIAASKSDLQADEIPSYSQAHHWYSVHADQKAVMIARNGEEWFRNNVAGFIQRRAPRVDECWVGDHHIFDAAVRVFDQEAGVWKAVRPWVTAWLDWGSLYFAGHLIRTIYPNRDSIERALREAIVRNGGRPPMHLYIDNGQDYTASLGVAKMLSDDDVAAVRGMAAMLNCRVHFAIPFNARAKVVERMFKEVCMRFSKLWTSYRGSNPTQRPETADEQWKNPESLPTLDQFVAAWEQWLAAIYNTMPRMGRILDGKSPLEARAAAQPLRPPLDAMAIYKAFLRPLGTRTVGRGGTVKALNRLYRSDQLWKLFGTSELVAVRLDPDNVDRVWCYTADGREIGPADAVPDLPALSDGMDGTPETIEQVREEMKAQRRQVREAKQASAASRDMSRYLRAGAEPAGAVFALPAGMPAAAAQAAKAIRAPADATAGMEVDADMAAELDVLLAAETAERMAELKGWEE